MGGYRDDILANANKANAAGTTIYDNRALIDADAKDVLADADVVIADACCVICD